MNYKAKMSQVKGALTGIYQQGQHRICIYEWKIGTEGNRDE